MKRILKINKLYIKNKKYFTFKLEVSNGIQLKKMAIFYRWKR